MHERALDAAVRRSISELNPRMIMAKRRLTITADDFGYCPERNRGVVECYIRGGITRASVLVNGEAAQEASSLSKKHSLSVGLHFNITEGKPVSQTTEVASLLKPDGMFWPKTEFRNRLLEQRSILLEQVAHELRQQIRDFERISGHLPAYVDGHNHVHVLPGVCDVFAMELRNAGITGTRIPSELDTEGCPWLDPARKVFTSEVSGYAREARDLMLQHGVRSTDGFVGMTTMGSDMTIERLQRRLAETFRHIEESASSDRDDVTIVELMVHPGYPAVPGRCGCGERPDDFAQSPDRLHEIGILCSEVMKKWYTKMNITLDAGT